MSDSKQIEWSWQDFVLWKLSTHSPCLESIEWDLAGSLQATSSELHSICLESIEWELAGAFYYYIITRNVYIHLKVTSSPVKFINPLNWLQANRVEFRGYCFKDPAKSHSICLESFFWLTGFTVQNPLNPTRFAWSQTNFLSNSDQSEARTYSSEELFPLDWLGDNFVHRLDLAGSFPWP